MIAFALVAAGVEHFRVATDVARNRLIGENIAYSHSLAMDAVWATFLAGAYFLWRRQVRGAWILFAVVVSHWILDVVSHRPDMPLAPGTDQMFGFGLWNSLPATLIVEGRMWVLAILFYVRARHSWTLWIGIAVITLAWLANISAPPSTAGSGVAAGLPSLIFFACAIGWACWIDRARLAWKGP